MTCLNFSTNSSAPPPIQLPSLCPTVTPTIEAWNCSNSFTKAMCSLGQEKQGGQPDRLGEVKGWAPYSCKKTVDGVCASKSWLCIEEFHQGSDLFSNFIDIKSYQTSTARALVWRSGPLMMVVGGILSYYLGWGCLRQLPSGMAGNWKSCNKYLNTFEEHRRTTGWEEGHLKERCVLQPQFDMIIEPNLNPS